MGGMTSQLVKQVAGLVEICFMNNAHMVYEKLAAVAA